MHGPQPDKMKAHSYLCCVQAACDVSCWAQGGSSGSDGLKDCDHWTGQTGLAGPEKARKQNKSQEVYKSLVEEAKGMPKVLVGYHSIKDWSGIINATEFSRACKLFLQQSYLKSSDTF